MKKQAGQAAPVFTFPFTATTCDSQLYIGNLRDNFQGIRGMICFFPTATQWQTCPVLIAAVAFAARQIWFFFPTGFKDGNRTGNCGCENGFRLLGTECTQTPNTIWGGSTRTKNDDRKRPDVFKQIFLKIAVQNDNQNMCANLIPQRKTQNATSSQKIRNASDDSRSKQRSSSTTRGMRGRTSIPNSRRPVERTETKRPGGATG